MKIPGGSPFRHMPGLQETKNTQKSTKTGKSNKSSSTNQVGELNATNAADVLSQAEEVDSPLYDVMAQESKRFENGEADIEEATRAVVAAMLKQHLGSRNIPDKALDEIAQTVSSSIHGDKTLRERLELALKRVANNEKKRTEKRAS